ncbi:MAG: flagellar basal body P-ring protein FlgI [Thermoguttaceae bacterium]|nr:flagellar basal body P-ring protein FlgI [Thermoguttaceae bacterium]MDW8039416.1 flagellar basal body P-ring protein FlgI [Thermoguttaceae bacterium]
MSKAKALYFGWEDTRGRRGYFLDRLLLRRRAGAGVKPFFWVDIAPLRVLNRSLLWLVGLVWLSGCTSWPSWNMLSRFQSPAEEEPVKKARLVGDMVVPFGLEPVRIENVGLVTGLPGTGHDPPPSPQRSALIAEMEARGVTMPNAVLASPDTAMVMVRGWLRPGIQKGDSFDVEVRVPSQGDMVSLRGGYLLETRLKEQAVLGGRILEGHSWALAKGPVLVDPTADSERDKVLLGRGRILGGGLCLKSRTLGLVLKPEHQNVANSARIAAAVNKRFYLSQKGVKTGVATAKTDQFIELAVHPRYKENIGRYLDVIRAIALREDEAQQAERMQELAKRLLDPLTARQAALELEAIGKKAVDILRKGLQAEDPEVRFYSAEALAYLDCREAAEPLAQIAQQQPAFRVYALAALGTMDDLMAYEQLCSLLHSSSAETRYGAFRALWTMNRQDPLVRGERLGPDGFSYHVLQTTGTPMVHVCTHKRAEIVLFGKEHRLRGPFFLEAGSRIVVRPNRQNPEELVISRFAVGQPDQQRIVPNQLDAMIRAIAELGGFYPDVLQALVQAKTQGALESRFEVDALPEPGRSYEPEDRHQISQTLEASDSRSASSGFLGRKWSKLFWPGTDKLN